MIKNINKDEFIKIVNDSKSKSDICRYLNISLNGNGFKIINDLINEFKIDVNFKKNNDKIKYERIIKNCPICAKEFETKSGSKKEKMTCSYSCSNKYFRSGELHGNWKQEAYRSTCFTYHEKKCVICDENKIVEVHHFDENRENNNIENLIPLCPTHHRYWHSRYKNLVFDKIIEYRNKFINLTVS